MAVQSRFGWNRVLRVSVLPSREADGAAIVTVRDRRVRRAWTVDDLVRCGFTRDDAICLAPRLPEVNAEEIRTVHYLTLADRDDLEPGSKMTPTGAILWVLYFPPHGIAQALGLTRDLLTLIEIFQALAVDCSSKPTVVMEALAWAEDDRLDDAEVVAYVRAGISRAEVDHFERCPEDKPNGGQLALLAGLRAAR